MVTFPFRSDEEDERKVCAEHARECISVFDRRRGHPGRVLEKEMAERIRVSTFESTNQRTS